MTIPDLIATILALIREDFYRDRTREYKRDERALTKALARYGYECHRRGWTFQVSFILAELNAILKSIRERKAEIKYLPVYLDGAIGRHVGQRSEELQAEARATNTSRATFRVVDGLSVVAVVEKTNTEVLGAIYKDLGARQRLLRTRATSKQQEMRL